MRRSSLFLSRVWSPRACRAQERACESSRSSAGRAQKNAAESIVRFGRAILRIDVRRSTLRLGVLHRGAGLLAIRLARAIRLVLAAAGLARAFALGHVGRSRIGDRRVLVRATSESASDQS